MGWIGRALDSVIGEFAPSAGRRRLADRGAMAALAMNYDGAGRGRRSYGWPAPATDADAAAQGARTTLRQLSRDFIRNRPYAVRAQSVVTGNVVGTGIVPSIRHPNPALQEQIAGVVLAHLLTPAIDARGELTLYGMQEVAMNAVFSDGEVLARRRMRVGPYADGLGLGFQIELLEADHLDTMLQSWGSNEVIEGIEYSPIGDVEAYHLYPVHPGAARLRGLTLQSQRVSWKDVIHVRRMDRPGQLRGVPWLAPVVMTVGELSDYQEAQILKQKMAALVAGVVTWDKDSEPGPGIDKLAGLSELQPGAIVAAPSGADLKWTDPPEVNDYAIFMREGLGALAMGIGITRESLSGDLSGVNFSSGRMGRMEMDRNVERWQQMLMIQQFCAGVARWVTEAWPLQKVLRREKFGIDWTAPRRPLIDPNDEIDAMLKQVDGGLNSRQGVQRTLGLDPDRVRRERADDQQRDDSAGVAAPVSQAPAPAAETRAKLAEKQETQT